MSGSPAPPGRTRRCALGLYARADLVTGDAELLDLAEPDIRIVTPAALVAELDRAIGT